VANDFKSSRYPLVPGHEIVGDVVEVGSNVKGLKVGSRVGAGFVRSLCGKCLHCNQEQEKYCLNSVPVTNGIANGQPTYGGFASEVVVDYRSAFELPAKLDSQNAAPLLCAGITVFSPLYRWVKPGQTVGILGIGGLGHLAIQFSHQMGFKTIAFSSSRDKEKESMEMGASHFVVTSDSGAMGRFKQSIDFLLCTVNVELPWSKFISLLKNGGKLCFVSLFRDQQKFNLNAIVGRDIQLVGSNYGSPEEMKKMLRFAAERNIVAQTELFPFSEVNAAVKKVLDNKIRYRAVLQSKF